LKSADSEASTRANDVRASDATQKPDRGSKCRRRICLRTIMVAPSMVRDIRDPNILQIWMSALEARSSVGHGRVGTIISRPVYKRPQETDGSGPVNQEFYLTFRTRQRIGHLSRHAILYS
jgi:hypothetical protein